MLICPFLVFRYEMLTLNVKQLGVIVGYSLVKMKIRLYKSGADVQLVRDAKDDMVTQIH